MLPVLKALRINQGLSQRALAEILEVSQQSINQYENRDTEPNLTVLNRMADYFGVSIDYIVGRLPQEGVTAVLTPGEHRFLVNFRALPEDQQQSCSLLIERMLRDNKVNMKK